MKTLIRILGLLAVTMLLPGVKGEGAPKQAGKAGDAVQDVVFLGDGRPVLVRLHIHVDGKPLLTAWNDFFLARILLSKEELLTWPLGLQRFQQQFQTQWNELAAASILISVPVVFLFLFSSKWLVSGVTAGGVKG